MEIRLKKPRKVRIMVMINGFPWSLLLPCGLLNEIYKKSKPRTATVLNFMYFSFKHKEQYNLRY
jgi:hypothetical protein